MNNKNEMAISNLEGFEGFVPYRRAGNTTRLMDYTIQLILQGKKVKLLDHAFNGENSRCNLEFAYKVRKRLSVEHPNLKYIIDTSNVILIDYNENKPFSINPTL